jgi:hypothetical protein
MTQQIVVALIVALAAIYAVWRWMPGSWRRAAAARLAAGSQRAGLVDEERAQQLAASLGKTSGCGACDTCGGCSTGASSKADADRRPPVTRSP